MVKMKQVLPFLLNSVPQIYSDDNLPHALIQWYLIWWFSFFQTFWLTSSKLYLLSHLRRALTLRDHELDNDEAIYRIWVSMRLKIPEDTHVLLAIWNYSGLAVTAVVVVVKRERCLAVTCHVRQSLSSFTSPASPVPHFFPLLSAADVGQGSP